MLIFYISLISSSKVGWHHVFCLCFLGGNLSCLTVQPIVELHKYVVSKSLSFAAESLTKLRLHKVSKLCSVFSRDPLLLKRSPSTGLSETGPGEGRGGGGNLVPFPPPTLCWNGVLRGLFLGIKMRHWNKGLTSLLNNSFSFWSTLSTPSQRAAWKS